MRGLPFNRPSHVEGRTNTTFFADTVRMPELAVLNFKNASFALSAHVDIPEGGARGVVISQGGSMAGWAVYLDDHGCPTYFYNYFGRVLTAVAGAHPVPPGRHEIGVHFTYDGGGLGKGGAVVVSLDDVEVASGRIEQTVPFLFSMSGETLDVGVSTGSSVGPYPVIYRFSGTIKKMDVELLSDMNEELAAAFGAGQARGALAQQ